MRAARLCLLLPWFGVGCAQVLGIEPWDADPEGQGGQGAQGPATSSTTGSTASSSGQGGATTSASSTTTAGGTQAGAGGAGGAPGCTGVETLCGEACVDLGSDAAHCGACDHGCLGATCTGAVCGAVSIGVLEGPRVLEAAGTSLWVIDHPNGAAARLLQVDLAAALATGAPSTLTLRHTLPAEDDVTLNVGSADAAGFYFAREDLDFSRVSRYLDAGDALLDLAIVGKATEQFQSAGMAVNGSRLWISAKYRDFAPDPDFGQAGVYFVDIGTSAQTPVPHCTRLGVGAPTANGLGPIPGGVAYGRSNYAGSGPDILSCETGNSRLLSTSPMQVPPYGLVADATDVYVASSQNLYRLPIAGGPAEPALFLTTPFVALLRDAGPRLVWRSGVDLVSIRKDAPASAPFLLDGNAASLVATLGDVVAWVRLANGELLLRRLPAD